MVRVMMLYERLKSFSPFALEMDAARIGFDEEGQ